MKTYQKPFTRTKLISALFETKPYKTLLHFRLEAFVQRISMLSVYYYETKFLPHLDFKCLSK